MKIKFLGLTALSTLFFSTIFFAASVFAGSKNNSQITCPSMIECDNGTCNIPYPPFNYYVIDTKQGDDDALDLVKVVTMSTLPHLVCEYESKDRTSQADIGSNDNISPDLTSPDYWMCGEGTCICGDASRFIAPSECPLIKNN